MIREFWWIFVRSYGKLRTINRDCTGCEDNYRSFLVIFRQNNLTKSGLSNLLFDCPSESDQELNEHACAAYTHRTITRSINNNARGIRKVRSAISSTHVRSIVDWIIIIIIIVLHYIIHTYSPCHNC